MIYRNTEVIESANPASLIAYFHSQRTGGTRFKQQLYKVFGRDRVFTPQTVGSENFVAWKNVSPQEVDGFDFYVGHCDYSEKDLKDVLYIATIRDPYVRLHSLYHYCKKKDGHKLQKIALTLGAEDFLDEAFKVMPQYVSNLQLRRLSGALNVGDALHLVSRKYALVADKDSLNSLFQEICKLKGKEHQEIESVSPDGQIFESLSSSFKSKVELYNEREIEFISGINQLGKNNV